MEALCQAAGNLPGHLRVLNNELHFHNIPLSDLVKKHGTPLKLFYLPNVRTQIQKTRSWFEQAMQENAYEGSYHYCYCTKSNNFAPVVKSALKEKVHLETSSANDVKAILQLDKKGELPLKTQLIHNGYKPQEYLSLVAKLINDGWQRSIIVLDNPSELTTLLELVDDSKKIRIGLRLAMIEKSSIQSRSRLGMTAEDIEECLSIIKKNTGRIHLEMLHFFVDSGVASDQYNDSLEQVVQLYTKLKSEHPPLQALNIGGGFPIEQQLGNQFDYLEWVNGCIQTIQSICSDASCSVPDIYTEFGKFSVGESGATIYSIEQAKNQDGTLWYLLNGSIINDLPDVWSIGEHFPVLPINHWDKAVDRVGLGGISCDQWDSYRGINSHEGILLPQIERADSKLQIGFFHTGAYQEALGGYGGITHCLIPPAKQVFIDHSEDGELIDWSLETDGNMLDILGY